MTPIASESVAKRVARKYIARGPLPSTVDWEGMQSFVEGVDTELSGEMTRLRQGVRRQDLARIEGILNSITKLVGQLRAGLTKPKAEPGSQSWWKFAETE